MEVSFEELLEMLGLDTDNSQDSETDSETDKEVEETLKRLDEQLDNLNAIEEFLHRGLTAEETALVDFAFMLAYTNGWHDHKEGENNDK